MRNIHVECTPDETLVKMLGFSRKYVTHHQGKSRVFRKLQQVENELAIVDEDPGSAKTTYEKRLQFVAESMGVKHYRDNRGNQIFVLKVRLEDWLIYASGLAGPKANEIGLPTRPKDLHSVINNSIVKLEKWLQDMINANNPAILHLRTMLTTNNAQN